MLLRDRDAIIQTSGSLSEICENLKCSTPHRSGFYFAGPALEGTTCGNNVVCTRWSPALQIKRVNFDFDFSGVKVANACQWRKLARKSRSRRPLVAGASGRKKNAILAVLKTLKVKPFSLVKSYYLCLFYGWKFQKPKSEVIVNLWYYLTESNLLLKFVRCFNQEARMRQSQTCKHRGWLRRDSLQCCFVQRW